MSEVSVLFQGMILWWAASNPAVVLVPDLQESQVPHTASISAPPSAFVGGACPDGFLDVGGNCYFRLDNAGKTGGVQIELLSNTPAATAFAAGSMCAVPPLQHAADDPLVLRSKYTPPSGTGNTAWMSVLGGMGSAVMASCSNPPDCPRFGKWTVTAGPASNVVLVLKNLAAGPPRLTLLNDGAELTIANIPVPTALHARREKPRDGSTTEKDEHPLMTDSAEDWCEYFAMVSLRSNSAEAATPCPGKPPIPACSAPLQARRTQTRGDGMGIQTIACSSSQYP